MASQRFRWEHLCRRCLGDSLGGIVTKGFYHFTSVAPEMVLEDSQAPCLVPKRITGLIEFPNRGSPYEIVVGWHKARLVNGMLLPCTKRGSNSEKELTCQRLCNLLLGFHVVCRGVSGVITDCTLVVLGFHVGVCFWSRYPWCFEGIQWTLWHIAEALEG